MLVGLDGDEVLVACTDTRYIQEVDASLAQARALGINGAYLYMVASRYGAYGARPDALADALSGDLHRGTTL